LHEASGKRGRALAAATVLLAACGGGGDPEPPPYDESTGIWTGTSGEPAAATIAIVDHDDFTVYQPDLGALRHGTLASRGGVIDSQVSYLTAYEWAGAGSNGYPMTLSGSVSPRHAIVATATDSRVTPPTFPVSLRYDPARFERPASLARIAGRWRDESGTWFVEWRIDASSGDLTGSDSNGCAYRGRVTVPDPSRNLYRIDYSRWTASTGPDYVPRCYGGNGIRARAFLDDGAAREDTLRSFGLLPGTLFTKGDAHVENLVRR
jgi:hypothetical protein